MVIKPDIANKMFSLLTSNDDLEYIIVEVHKNEEGSKELTLKPYFSSYGVEQECMLLLDEESANVIKDNNSEDSHFIISENLLSFVPEFTPDIINSNISSFELIRVFALGEELELENIVIRKLSEEHFLLEFHNQYEYMSTILLGSDGFYKPNETKTELYEFCVKHTEQFNSIVKDMLSYKSVRFTKALAEKYQEEMLCQGETIKYQIGKH